jgi:hypothetical protein
VKLRLFIVLAAFYMVVASREQPWGDARVVYETTQNLVENFRIDVEPHGPAQFYVKRLKTLAEKRADLQRRWKRAGRPGIVRDLDVRGDEWISFGVFPLGNVVAMAPGYLLYKLLHLVPHAPDELLFRLTSHLPPSLMIAGACVLFFTMCRRHGASERVAAWLALLLGTSTILVVYARSPYSEALQTLAFTWVVERSLAVGERPSRRGAVGLGVACGLLFNSKLVYALALPIAPLYLIACHRRNWRPLVAALAFAAVPMALLGGLAVWHNWYKTRTLLDTGYAIPDGVFSGDAYAALFGYYFSTGKSLFLYSPPLLLGLAALPWFVRTYRRPAIFLGAISGVVVLANAKFRYWHADYCWGPRLLVPLTPAWLLPAAGFVDGALARGRRELRAIAVGALVGAGLWAQLLGSAFYWDHYIRIAIAVKDQTGAGGWYGEDLHHCHFIPQFSPLVGHAWLLRHRLADDDPMVDVPWKRVAPGKVNVAPELAATRFDLWELDWFEKHSGARAWGAAFLLLFAVAGGAAALGLGRRLRRPREAAQDQLGGRGEGHGGEREGERQ